MKKYKYNAEIARLLLSTDRTKLTPFTDLMISTTNFDETLSRAMAKDLSPEMRAHILNMITELQKVTVIHGDVSPRSVLAGFERAISVAPPPKWEKALSMFLKPADRQWVMGDLIEEYHKNRQKHGERWARVLYRIDVFRFIVSIVLGWAEKLTTLLRKLGS